MTVKGLFAKQIGTIQEMRLLFLFCELLLMNYNNNTDLSLHI